MKVHAARGAQGGRPRRPIEPGLTDPKTVKAGLARLEQSQWWDPDRLLQFQGALLRPLLVHAFETVPHYNKLFREAKVRPRLITPENWHEVPILTRGDVQDGDLISRRIPKQHGVLCENQTSGSTGQPVDIKCTGYSQFIFKLMTLRDHLWHKRDFMGKHASIRFASGEPDPEGTFSPNWGRAMSMLYKTGPACMLNNCNPIEVQLEWLQKHNPDYLLIYPSCLQGLLELSRKQGASLSNLKEVRTISEMISPELRALCRETWGVPMTDVYSSQEFGYLAVQCPEHEHYHVQSENVLIEILDDEGQPCKPGEIGRIVVSTLRNYAMPLIRYEIRDYAIAGEPCACGRGLPVIKQIVGRQRNLLTMPSGEKRYARVGWYRYKEVAPVKQFQFVQHSLEEIEMRLVTERKLKKSEQQALKEIVLEAFGHPFNLTLTFLDTIPQGKNGKFEEFLSLVSDATAAEKVTLHES